MGISETIEKAIKESGISQYKICRDTGIEKSTLSRFMTHQQELRMPNLEKLLIYFGYQLIRGNGPYLQAKQTSRKPGRPRNA